MKAPRAWWFFGRLVYAGFLLGTSVYCLLTYIPFTYQQVHVGELLPWLTRLVHFHPFLYWVALVALAPTLWRDLQSRRAKLPAWALLLAGVAGGVAIAIHPVLVSLGNDRASLVWSVVWLGPLVWVAACDWLAGAANLRWSDEEHDEDARTFGAAWRTAVYLALVYAVVQYARSALTHNAQFPARQWAWSVLWSLLSHLVFFLGAFVLLSLVTAVAAWSKQKRSAELAGVSLLAAAIAWLVFRSVVFRPLSFRGWQADLVAAAMALSLTAFSMGVSVGLYRKEDGAIESGLDLMLWPMRFLARWSRAKQAVFFAGLAVTTYVLASRSAMLDWEYLVQTLVAVWVWTVTFAAFFVTRRVKPGKGGMPWGYVAAGLTLVAYAGLLRAEPRGQEAAGIAPSEAAELVDEYANYDVSFRLVDGVISHPAETGGGDASGAFYTFLVENTHIARSRPVSPVEIELVKRFAPTSGPKPNVFLIVIDSLRRDYLGAYNHAVDFTPAFDSFARESVVMENAFTHYGGTGLSEPAIWVGGLMLHKEYVTPFQPMNTLKKLVDAEGYDAYVSKDTILQTVLGPSPEIKELDAHIGTMSYDLCRTLAEVEQRLPERDASKPMFVYTQPQNIHVSVIDREGRSVPEGERFPSGFNPPYASRVKHMDGCFGRFIAALKKAGMYDNSVIVVTADHGDSLGERGRWGHAYAIFPEIAEVPLIIHLPLAMKAKLAWDTKSVAFLSDITPTLYALLGQTPENDPMYGRPLFTATLAEQAPYGRNAYLIVSSYAPVYGILSRDGTKLYIADAVNYRDYYYDLGEDRRGISKPITEELRKREQGLIRQQVLEIARFYHLQ